MFTDTVLQTTLLQAAVEQAFNAVLITTADLHGEGPLISYCNPAFCSMTGYQQSELLGVSPRILQGPLTDKTILEQLRMALREQTYFQGATFNYRKDGSTYLVEWNISPVRDSKGEIEAYVSVQQDITQRVFAQQRQALLAQALNSTQDAVLIVDQHAKILFVNQAYEKLTGYSRDELIGHTPHILHSGQHPAIFYSNLRDTLLRGESFQATFINRHKSGRIYYAAQTITPLQDETGKISHYVSVSKDVSDMVVHTQELSKQANYDVLTGLLNRRAGEKQLRMCDLKAQKEHQGYALILGDIDGFKQINDSYGHDIGDGILKQCAALLKASVRSSDAVIRWGGEEFLVVLPNCSVNVAQALAELLRTEVAALQSDPVPNVSMSFGVAAWQPFEHHTELLRRTDKALYSAKQDGKNLVVVA